MTKALVGALTLALASLPSALAFRNTSPFFLFSTSALPTKDGIEIAKASTVVSLVEEALNGCPSQTYFVVRQEGVALSDYADRQAAPQLGSYMSGRRTDIKSTITIPDTVGSVDGALISDYLVRQCGAEIIHMDRAHAQAFSRPEGSKTRVVELTLPAPNGPRASVLAEHDKALGELVNVYVDSGDYTVIYTTTPPPTEAGYQNQQTYEFENTFDDVVHMELKRDTSFHERADSKKEGALFEKYQFLSPGLFMGITATIPLFLILYFGLSSLASLEVSYFAFSKEMGPSAQKKQ